jgi:hypothetical protein
MKKLLLAILLLPMIAISQDTLHIPAPAAKAMVQQLVSCDSVKAIHELTKEQLTFTEKKVEVQDSMISGYHEKMRMYKEMLYNEQEKFEVQNKWTDELRKDVRNLRISNKIYKTGFWAGLFIGTIGYIYLAKPF